MIGVSFGVAAFLVVITVLNSFQSEMKHIISAVNPNLIIYSTSGIYDPLGFQKKLHTLISEPIENMGRFVYQESVLSLGRNSSTVYLRAIEGTRSASARNLHKFITPQGALRSLDDVSPFLFNNPKIFPPKKSGFAKPSASKNSVALPTHLPHVILGKELAENLNAKKGSILNLMHFQSGKKILEVEYHQLSVTGILTTGLSEYDQKFAFINFEDGLRLFGTKDWASGIEINFKNPDHALEISRSLKQKVPYQVVAWQQIDRGIFEQIERDSTAIKLIVFIISFVAGFNIIVTLSLTVIDRSKQIALLRALGAKKSLIIGTFVASGTLLGTLGATLGVGAGILILKIFSGIHLGDFQKFYYLEKVPVHIEVHFIVVAFLTSVLLSFFGALYPAWKASRVSPMHGLRQESE